MDGLVVRSRAYSDELKRAAEIIEHAAWIDLGFLSYTRPHQEHYASLLDEYADLQLCLVNLEADYPVAAVNCVPVPNVGVSELPPEGWDWLVETGATSKGGPSKLLGALAVSVPPVHRGKGYARKMIQALREMAEERGFERVVTPVRPSSKHRHPFVSMDEYIQWTDESGRTFDPWLRSHLGEGGRVVRPCDRSMVVEEHVAFWETWAGKRFETSGDHLVKGALAPIHIDLEKQLGRYEEPNVWVTYSS